MATGRRKKKKKSRVEEKKPLEKRSWSQSALRAAIIMVLLLVVAIGSNAAFGRVIQWNIVAYMAFTAFVFLTIGLRYRTL